MHNNYKKSSGILPSARTFSRLYPEAPCFVMQSARWALPGHHLISLTSSLARQFCRRLSATQKFSLTTLQPQILLNQQCIPPCTSLYPARPAWPFQSPHEIRNSNPGFLAVTAPRWSKKRSLTSSQPLCGAFTHRMVFTCWPTISFTKMILSGESAPQKFSLSTLRPQIPLNQQCLCYFQTTKTLYLVSLPLIVCLLPPQYNVSSIQQTSTFLWDCVSTTSQTLPLRVFALSVPTLNFLGCLLDSPQWPDPASHTWQEAKMETLPMEFYCLLAQPNYFFDHHKDFGTFVCFYEIACLSWHQTQFFNSI